MRATRSGHNTYKTILSTKDWLSLYPQQPGFLPSFLSEREFAIAALNKASEINPFSRIMSVQLLNELSDTELSTYLHEMVSFD
jgi:hypothetical protein